MNIFEYIDKKRTEYEGLRDESKLQLKKNQNRVEKISAQIGQMTEEEENPSQFFLPESSDNYKEEIEKAKEKIDDIESENTILLKKIKLCEDEIYLLDTLELPDFSGMKKEAEWTPMRVPEEDFQKKNVSRETMQSSEDVSRETFYEGEKEVRMEAIAEENIDKNLLREKISFCRQISELDPRRCSLLLDEIIHEIL